MKIQEYTCETMPQSEEFTEEAKLLIEKLGADGQKLFYQSDSLVPFPYRKMTPTEHAVYKTMLPIREELKKYNAGPVPLRVLQIAAHASEQMPGTLIIWHQGAGKDDPLLTLREGNEYSGSYYLLARWADELEEFSVLLNHAVEKIVTKVLAELQSAKVQLAEWEAGLEERVRARLLEGKMDAPTIHWY